MVKVTTEMYVQGWFSNRLDYYIEQYYGELDIELEQYLRKLVLEWMPKIHLIDWKNYNDASTDVARVALRIIQDLVNVVQESNV